ncbi:MAG: hypothetical protein FJY54_18860 [Betaproteobacteria bacterium]|nr:hypothetical protein [Betaproteobacteria bacterium]
MKRIVIVEAELTRLVAALKQFAGKVCPSQDPAWSRPLAIRIVDCVLSLRRNYDRFVVPRLEALMRAHPELHTIAQLEVLVAGYQSPSAFVERELNYKHPDRARILASVIRFVAGLVQGVSPALQAEALERWATSARPEDFKDLNIKGFKLAGFQYLRMLFGAQTTKPDQHIIAFVSESIGRQVSDVEALVLLEAATARLNLPLRDVDTTIWESRARSASA